MHVIVYGGFVLLILRPSSYVATLKYKTRLRLINNEQMSRCIWENGLLLDIRCKQLQLSPLTLELKAFRYLLLASGGYTRLLQHRFIRGT